MRIADLPEDYLNDLSVVLFPHCYIADKSLRKMIPTVERLTICQPWFMELPLSTLEGDETSFIDILLPPDNMKPKEDFKRLLSEYQIWMRQNQDRGYAAFLSATRKATLSEDTPWEIRKMIRQTGKNTPISQESHALKWHLILHLAWEFEKNSVEAEEMLNQMKQQKSPLEEALGDGARLQGLFEDLPQSEANLFVDEHHIKQVFEAWLGLFGGYLKDYKHLITLDRNVMKYVTDIFEDEKNNRMNPFLTYLSGKTITLLDG